MLINGIIGKLVSILRSTYPESEYISIEVCYDFFYKDEERKYVLYHLYVDKVVSKRFESLGSLIDYVKTSARKELNKKRFEYLFN